ncbi:molecular chaperone HscC [Methylophilus sp. 13]|uniref:Hsp70 family protein n=1 Tax=Methylophilus sp. 13 TaxID=2781018 RepID=UPI00188F3CD9|nr:molecular chaperone HscC [Methylophilus sp. 13]MBF5040467.1 molecular chaperone HscC [Methylophilus sp. 13]
MIFGIDLGTTNSLICYLKDGKPEAIPNAMGKVLTPSVVGVDDTGTVFIGAAARERLYKFPNLTAHSFKRLMGTKQSIKLGAREYKPEDLSALVLRALKSDAEAYLGVEVKDVVISVPAYFNDNQRKATKLAGQLAGLNVLRLINEPTAAALFHGIQDYEAAAKFLIFDLGGGTFDVSILEKFDGIMEVRATGGDSFLGGDDFTQVLVSLFAEKASLSYAQKQNPSTLSAIRFVAENAKRSFSEQPQITLDVIIDGVQKSALIHLDEYEAACKGLLDRLRTPIERALRDARLRVSDLDELVMVGGATRMAIIRKLVTQLFGRLPARYIDPDQTIALGAAVCAGLIDRNIVFDEVVLTDVCPHTLGTEVIDYDYQNNPVGLTFLPIIERNIVVPASRVQSVLTAHDGQTQLSIRVFQGESRDCSKNVLLDTIEIDIPSKPKGEISADIRFTYDINGMLEVDVDVEKANIHKSLIISKLGAHVDPEELEERRKVLAALKIHPRDQEENRYLVERAERLYEQSLGERRNTVRLVLTQFISVLEKQDLLEIKKARDAFNMALNSLESEGIW